MLAGKHALVTGAARGIGAAVTQALAAHGARVTMLGRNPNPAPMYVSADVTDPEAVARAFEEARKRSGRSTSSLITPEKPVPHHS
jgi:NAD(P)-dependent dehydrogenase (short-subunit alcohol dehydrogenase family)